MEVIVMKVVGKEGRSVIAGVVGPGIGPLTGDGLDEAFGLAVSLRAIGFGEEMFEAELMAGGGEGFGAIGGAAIGEDLMDNDAMSGVEGEGLVQSVEDALESVRQGADKRRRGGSGESMATWRLSRPAPGLRKERSPVARTPGRVKRPSFLKLEVEEVAWGLAFVAQRRRFGRFERREAIEVMTAQDAGKSGLGDGENHPDLSVRAALAAQNEDLGFELGAGLARLGKRPGGMIVQALREASLLGAGEPSTNGLLADAESDGSGPQGEAELRVLESHLGSGERSKSGISVHVARAEGVGLSVDPPPSCLTLPARTTS